MIMLNYIQPCNQKWNTSLEDICVYSFIEIAKLCLTNYSHTLSPKCKIIQMVSSLLHSVCAVPVAEYRVFHCSCDSYHSHFLSPKPSDRWEGCLVNWWVLDHLGAYWVTQTLYRQEFPLLGADTIKTPSFSGWRQLCRSVNSTVGSTTFEGCGASECKRCWVVWTVKCLLKSLSKRSVLFHSMEI